MAVCHRNSLRNGKNNAFKRFHLNSTLSHHFSQRFSKIMKSKRRTKNAGHLDIHRPTRQAKRSAKRWIRRSRKRSTKQSAKTAANLSIFGQRNSTVAPAEDWSLGELRATSQTSTSTKALHQHLRLLKKSTVEIEKFYRKTNAINNSEVLRRFEEVARESQGEREKARVRRSEER